MIWTVNKLFYEKESFYVKESQMANQTQFRIEKVIERKGDKQNEKWKGYDNWFNILIDKKGYGYIDLVILLSRTLCL